MRKMKNILPAITASLIAACTPTNPAAENMPGLDVGRLMPKRESIDLQMLSNTILYKFFDENNLVAKYSINDALQFVEQKSAELESKLMAQRSREFIECDENRGLSQTIGRSASTSLENGNVKTEEIALMKNMGCDGSKSQHTNFLLYSVTAKQDSPQKPLNGFVLVIFDHPAYLQWKELNEYDPQTIDFDYVRLITFENGRESRKDFAQLSLETILEIQQTQQKLALTLKAIEEQEANEQISIISTNVSADLLN